MIDVGAGTLIKYGLAFAAFVAFCVALIGYGEHRKQLEWDASLTRQAMETANQVIEQARNTAQIETKYIHVAGATKVLTKVVKEEVVRYVETAPTMCNIDRDFERIFDRISGMLDAEGGEPMPTADSASSRSDLPAGPTLTCTQVLLAYEFAISEWRTERDRNRALSEWAALTALPLRE